MDGDILVMRQAELKRLELIKRAMGKEATQFDVAGILGISLRQVQRIVKRVKDSGDKGVVHQRRGKVNCRRINDVLKAKVLRIYARDYRDFGATLASEKLAKNNGIILSRETLRKWLRQEGYESAKRRRRQHRSWRARKEYCGQMIQMDGSHHDWLEGRGPRLVLMGYVDDATSRVFGRFYEYEGTLPALDSFKRYCLKYGVPQSVYLDCHSTYKARVRDKWHLKEFLPDEGLSEFERALQELGVKVIHAYSPQAKGRVERLFRTLQDRLVKELRLVNAKTMKEANEGLEEYLSEHNRRYMVDPVCRADLHRHAPSSRELDNMLCKKKEHPLRKDFTIIHGMKLYQVLEWTSADHIEVREHVNGGIRLMGRGRSLKFKEIDQPPVKKRVVLSQKGRRPGGLMGSRRSFGTALPQKRQVFSFV